MRFGNNNPVFRRVLNEEFILEGATATYKGVASKLLFFVAMTLIGAFGGLALLLINEGLFVALLMVSAFTTFIFALIAMFSPRLSKVMGSLYCIGQGMVIGIVSLAFSEVAPGSVMIALLSTVVVIAVVATLYITNVVKVNQRFVSFLTTFAISVMISLIIIWILGATVYRGMEFSFGMNLLVSGIVIFLATLYLFFNMEQVRQVVEGGAPKVYEWYVAFGLIFIIIWLYLEILPLVARIILSER